MHPAIPPPLESLFCLSPAAECCFGYFFFQNGITTSNCIYWEPQPSETSVCQWPQPEGGIRWATLAADSDAWWSNLPATGDINSLHGLWGSPSHWLRGSVEGEQGWWWGGESPALLWSVFSVEEITNFDQGGTFLNELVYRCAEVRWMKMLTMPPFSSTSFFSDAKFNFLVTELFNVPLKNPDHYYPYWSWFDCRDIIPEAMDMTLPHLADFSIKK